MTRMISADAEGTTQTPVASFKAVALKLLEPCPLDEFPSAQHKQEGLTMMIITNGRTQQQQSMMTLMHNI